MTNTPPRGAPLRRVARFASLAGLGTVAITVAFLLLPDVKAAVDACGGRTPSLIQFQLAASVPDVEAALGPAGACRDAAIAAMNSANRLDVSSTLLLTARSSCSLSSR